MSQEMPRALLVLGAPRSGTTVIGSYLGSSADVVDLGEYGGFYMAHEVVPSVMGQYPGAYRDAYLRDLRYQAQGFAEETAVDAGRRWYCDATPWNLRCAGALAAQLPDAVFVLTLRHFAGSVQSLRRSYAAGFRWAGASFAESAQLWAALYQHVAQLPPERTVVFGYDLFAADPEVAIAKLEADLAGHGLDVTGTDRAAFAVSHANKAGPRPTAGVVEAGGIRLRPFPSVELESWSGDIQAAVWPLVRDVHLELRGRFPDAYQSPPRPGRLLRHDEVRGLVPADLDGW